MHLAFLTCYLFRNFYDTHLFAVRGSKFETSKHSLFKKKFIVTRENSRIAQIFFLTNFRVSPFIFSTRKEKRELKYLTTVIPYNAERGCPALPTLQERPYHDWSKGSNSMFRIRIQIGSGFNRVCGFRIKEDKNYPQKRKEKWRIWCFEVLNVSFSTKLLEFSIFNYQKPGSGFGFAKEPGSGSDSVNPDLKHWPNWVNQSKFRLVK